MTAATEIVRRDPASFGGGRQPAAVSQATAIEQQRAIAEVQAAVVVSQNCPRDMAEAEREMEYVCGRLDMAEQAFYQVTNRGTGPTVHLMRELARIWGNVDHGVKELHRNDVAGESEVQAFAWDIQKNTRSSRTFIVPHQRMVKGQRKDLVDLQDIYLNNQNIGARAVRECIGTILPRWFTEKAQNVCHETLKHGEGKPLRDRIESLIGAFQTLGVTVEQLEARIGRQRGQWTPEDVAQLTVAGQSIRRGEAQKDELFPPAAASSSTADEIAPAAPAEGKPAKARTGPGTTRTRKSKTDAKQSDPEPEPSSAEQPAEPEATQVTAQETRTGDGDTNEAETTVEETTADPGPGAQESDLRKAARQQLNAAIFATFGELKLNGDEQRADRLVVIREIVGRQIDSTKDLTDDELQQLRNSLISRKQAGTLDADVTEWLNIETMRQDSAAAEGGQ